MSLGLCYGRAKFGLEGSTMQLTITWTHHHSWTIIPTCPLSLQFSKLIKPQTSVKFWDYRSILSDHNVVGFGLKWVTNFNLTNRIKGLSHIFLVHWSTQWPCNNLPVIECKLQHPTCMCTHTHTHTQELQQRKEPESSFWRSYIFIYTQQLTSKSLVS